MKSIPAWLVMVLATGALLGWAAWRVSDGSWPVLVLVGLAAVGFGWWSYPRRGAGISHRDTLGTEGKPIMDVVIYWRPGCMYCEALRRGLGKLQKSATWINIWADPEAAAYVRSVNEGNETVPTVVIDGVPHTNPSPGLVKERLLQAEA